MPSSCIKKKTSFLSHCTLLADCIVKYKDFTIRFCSYYIADNCFCFILKELNKCKYCIQLDYSYNLTISSVKLNQINKELQQLYKEKRKLSQQLYKEKRELRVKKKRLYKQITFLLKCQAELINIELQADYLILRI